MVAEKKGCSEVDSQNGAPIQGSRAVLPHSFLGILGDLIGLPPGRQTFQISLFPASVRYYSQNYFSIDEFKNF
jgi:hypothetical protein